MTCAKRSFFTSEKRYKLPEIEDTGGGVALGVVVEEMRVVATKQVVVGVVIVVGIIKVVVSAIGGQLCKFQGSVGDSCDNIDCSCSTDCCSGAEACGFKCGFLGSSIGVSHSNCISGCCGKYG